MSHSKTQRKLAFHARRVLVVDDFHIMRKSVIYALTSALDCDVELVEASHGVEALAQFEPSKFDLIITDWKMPVMDGLELVKNIRSVDATVPIIMVTTEVLRGRVVEALESGVNDYLIKPFKHEFLVEKVSKWLTVPVYGGNT